MTWTYEPADYLSFGGNAAEAAKEALKDGPFGLFWRRDMARAFQACGQNIDLSGIHTTCAVFASACWFWAGRKLKHPRASHIGSGIIGDTCWLEAGREIWVPHHGDVMPGVGDIMCYGASISTVHHVDLVVEVTEDEQIITAHGGDSPTYTELVAAGIARSEARRKEARGTVARLGIVPKGFAGACGWMSAAKAAEAEGL